MTQLSLFEKPAPPKAKRCIHRWIPLGVEAVVCEKCQQARIDVDGQHFKEVWPLAPHEGKCADVYRG